MNYRLILIVAGALVALYWVNRSSAPEKVDQSSEVARLISENARLTKTIELQSEKLSEFEKTKKIVEIDHPNGVKIKTTYLRSTRKVTEHKAKTEEAKQVSSQTDETRARGSSSIAASSRGALVSFLAGAPWADPSTGLVYGASIQFPLPILDRARLGVWAIPQFKWAIGGSIGVEF